MRSVKHQNEGHKLIFIISSLLAHLSAKQCIQNENVDTPKESLKFSDSVELELLNFCN